MVWLKQNWIVLVVAVVISFGFSWFFIGSETIQNITNVGGPTGFENQ